MAPAEKIPLPFRWQFVPHRDKGGMIRWTWRAYSQGGELTMQSERTYDSLTECIQDAKAQGYDRL